MAGVPATYTLTVTNTSPVEDSFVITAGVSSWTIDLPDDPIGPLMPGEAAQVSLTATPPRGKPERVRLVVTSTAASGRCLDLYLNGFLLLRRYYFPVLPVQGAAP